jgi:acyl-CoA dehydrogenase
MSDQMDHENELLINTLKAFMDAEIFPYEDEVDAKGEVPIELGRQIEKRAKDIGLFSANLPTEIGSRGSLDLLKSYWHVKVIKRSNIYYLV